MRRHLLKLRKSSLFKMLVKVSLAFLIAFGISKVRIDYLESLSYDWRVAVLPDPPTSNKLYIVEIDEKTVGDLNGSPTALDHARFLDRLGEAKPSAIVYVIDPSDISGTYEELEEFTASADKAGVIVASRSFPNTDPNDESQQLLPPLDRLKVMSGPKTADNVSFGKDGVSRRWIHSFKTTPLLHTELTQTLYPQLRQDPLKGLFQYKRTVQGLVEFRRTGFYPRVTFEKVMRNQFNQADITGKIVVVGFNAKASLVNYVKTPFSRDLLAMPVAELHANIFDTVLLNRSPITPDRRINLLIVFLISVLTVFVVLSLRPTHGLVILLSTLIGFSVISIALLYFFQVKLVMAQPLMAIFVCYYFFIPYRLIIENRKSWEYYQKNNILTQVEELKTNFLKMMSHDLKTPLARIQGMADVVLQESKNLDEEQQKALRTISNSSVELSEFIGSILSYGRIESKEIKLMLQSKDINKLIKDVTRKCQFLAKEKDIEIVLELEPLFSINFDPELIQQVLTNLVENAIKYSPEGKKILVTSEEIDGKVIIQVADQGYGIPEDELENVFSKFYRSKTMTGSAIKGSGLGLYLANYFVTLHHGQIVLESVEGEGSTFSVEIPSDLEIPEVAEGRS